MLAAILEKTGFIVASEWVKAHVSNELVALILFLCLIVWIALRINKVIEQAHDKEEEQNSRIAVTEKRTEKIINAICETPCFKDNSANCIWIQRDDRNGGKLPEKSRLPIAERKRGQIMWDKFMPPEMPIVKRVTKLEWLLEKQKPIQPQHKPARIVVHHSYSPDSKQFKGDETIRAIHRYHTVNKGWADIGYHYLISPDGGRIYEGRPELQIGAHCGGDLPAGVTRNFGNTDSIGICLIGNYDIEQPTKEALYTLAILIFSLIEKYGMAQNAVYGHCEAWSRAPKNMPWSKAFY